MVFLLKISNPGILQKSYAIGNGDFPEGGGRGGFISFSSLQKLIPVKFLN